MSGENESEIVPRRKRATPEQLQRRQEVDKRNRIIQTRGVPAPKSGTFGLAKAREKK